MRIRGAQMQTLGDAMQNVFEDEMLAHLAEFSPPLFNAVKEEQMREAIRFGIERAGKYGFTYRGPVRLYLELMLLFGSHFDTDPQYPWSADILRDQDFGPQMQRAELLFERTRDYRARVAGPQDVYTLKALRKIAGFARNPLPITWDNFASAMQAEVARIYPQKAAYLGDAGVKSVVFRGISRARGYGFTSARASVLLVVLMFAFGHGCFDDPLYPWIARTLAVEAEADPEARAKRLEKKALTWLDHVLANLDPEGTTA